VTLTLAGAGVALAGVALAVYAARTVGLRGARERSLAGTGVVVAGVGVAIVIAGLSSALRAPGSIDARRNPTPPTSESLAIGERIYRAHCLRCHGADGRGRGPAAATLFPRPTNFVAHFGSGHVHPDGRLYYWITEGMAGTGMPAFRGRLSEMERWHVINFIKNFAPVDR